MPAQERFSTDFLPAGVRSGIRRAVDADVLLVLGVFLWQGFSLVTIPGSLEFPAMEISRGYLSLPIGACLIVAILLSSRSDVGGRGKEEGPGC
jgi:TRAP-type C4-dicarboxylate transport system permease small subunit